MLRKLQTESEDGALTPVLMALLLGSPVLHQFLVLIRQQVHMFPPEQFLLVPMDNLQHLLILLPALLQLTLTHSLEIQDQLFLLDILRVLLVVVILLTRSTVT
jgi:hypothetical protein